MLLELGTEELPPKLLAKLSIALKNNLEKLLNENNLNFDNIKNFASPRRIAIIIDNLITIQPDRKINRKGPTVDKAYDAKGEPTKALLGFAKSCGLSLEQLTVDETNKGTWIMANVVQKGKTTAELLPNIITTALKKLPINKAMHWGNKTGPFIRPLHWLILTFNNKIVPLELFGIKSSNISYGHRFMSNQAITVTPKNYENLLEKNFVIADFKQRKNIIQQQIAKLTLNAIIEPELLDYVTAIVEWPVALLGKFNPDFLQIPQEALISAMQDHQRCFPVTDNNGKLTAQFIIVSNMHTNDPHNIIHGNERVMSARLADAVFYYQQDKNQTLASRYDLLKNVVFQAKLGSLQDKITRIIAVAKQLNMCPEQEITTAAKLCKNDLLTKMVYEFPELQGIMGYYYAKHDGETLDIAESIRDHYLPRFAEDTLPTKPLSVCLALADRLDNLIGIFSIGKAPTGDKDPFGLRRQALAIVKILIHNKLDLDLLTVTNEQVFKFCIARLTAWFTEQGINPRLLNAINTCSPYDFQQRLLALQEFSNLPEAKDLAAANKRIRNILKKVPDLNCTIIKENLFQETAEKTLFAALNAKQQAIEPLIAKKQYNSILKTLAELHSPIDNFFDNVMVMCDDTELKNNRLQLMLKLRQLFMQVADISEI